VSIGECEVVDSAGSKI